MRLSLRFSIWFLIVAATGAGCMGEGVSYRIDDPPPELASEPAWAPDGARIAYTVHDSIWVLDLATMSSSPFIRGNLAAWSPNGAKLAFVRYGDVFVRDLETSEDRQMTFRGGCYFPAWSPTGDELAYDVSAGPDQGVWVIGEDGTRDHQVVERNARMPAWSPDGETIAFTRAVGSTGLADELFFFQRGDSTITRMTTDDCEQRYPSWSPSGEYVAFSLLCDGLSNPSSGLWLLRVSDGTLRRLAPNIHAAETFAFHPSWSPDSRQVAYSGYDVTCCGYVLFLVNADGTGARSLCGSVTSSPFLVAP